MRLASRTALEWSISASERYQVLRRLAVGGMGEIFLARQEIAGVHRLVVLKRLLPGLAEDAELLAMFVDEARIAANLAHPGIVQVHEFGEDEQGHFMVMEYVPGHNVAHILGRSVRDDKPLPVGCGVYIVHETARALDHAHHARDSDGTPLEIVHRDISPSNVLVSFRGDVKLMDFGVARAANRAHRTNDGSIRGKIAYMSPEQIGGRPLDARSDVFAMGVMLWEITLGKRLFTGASDFEVMRAAVERPIPRPSSVEPSYPAALESIVMSALERDPEQRLASAADLATALKTYLRANPTDRDELAAYMASLYPNDAAESEKLEVELTRPRGGEAPTAILAAAPNMKSTVRLPDGNGAVAARRSSAPRRAFVVVAVLAALATAGWFGAAALRERGRETDVVTTAPYDALADAPPDTATTVVAQLPVDAAVADAPPDALDKANAERSNRTSGGRRHVSSATGSAAETANTTTARRESAPDAGVRSASVELGGFHFYLQSEEGPAFLIDNHKRCTLDSLPTRCPKLEVGSMQTFTFRVGTDEFAVSLRTPSDLMKCELLPSKKNVRCP